MKQETARATPSANPKISVSNVPFSETPGQSRLFLDYLQDPISLRKYYPNVVTSPADVAWFAPEVLANYRTDRRVLSEALMRLNGALGAGDATMANARSLSEPGTVAVVTGQQAGLFTGPLYTVYKALSAIRMADELSAKGLKAVPVFWIATEDHDLDEVAQTSLLDRHGEIVRTGYRPSVYLANAPVGTIEVDRAILQVVDDLFALLPETQFSPTTRELLARTWEPTTTFGASFAKTILRLLGKFGIVVIDPLDAQIKHLAAPIYEQATRKAEIIVTAVRRRSDELEKAGYHAQVAVEETYFPLFWHNDPGQRLALRKTGDGVYRTKDGSSELAIDKLAGIAKSEPQRLSPGVILRPVVQDHLLPTICYFGGSAEVAYFAQNSEVYRVLDRPVTPIFHRQSFTIVGPKQRRNLDKLNLKLKDLFAGREEILLRAAGTEGSATTKLFTDVQGKIEAELDRLDRELSNIDPTLTANLATRRRKIVHHIEALSKKTLATRSRQDETMVRRVDGFFAALLPNGELQERSLNVIGYLNEFGMNFIDWLYDAVDLEDKDHRIVDV